MGCRMHIEWILIVAVIYRSFWAVTRWHVTLDTQNTQLDYNTSNENTVTENQEWQQGCT